jgi:hypothetical protein
MFRKFSHANCSEFNSDIFTHDDYTSIHIPHTHTYTHITFTRYNNTHIKFAGPNPRLIID